MRRGIDHIMLAVADLDAARLALVKRGFQATPIGRHPMFGSANHLFMFPDDYGELLAIETITPEGAGLQRACREKAGLYGIALATEESEADFTRLSALGVPARPPSRYSRPVMHNGRLQNAVFKSTAVADDYVATVYPFFCQHETPELVYRPADMNHPNGATGILALVAVAHDPAGIAQKLALLFERASMTHDDEAAQIVSAGYRLDILTPEAFDRTYPQVGFNQVRLTVDDCVFSMAIFKCASLAQVERALGGEPVVKTGDLAIVPGCPALPCAFGFQAVAAG